MRARKRKVLKTIHFNSSITSTPNASNKSGYRHVELMSKTKAIARAIGLQDILTLKELGQSKYGFVNDKLRRKVWPILIESKRNADERLKKPRNDIIRQIHVDVQRTRFYNKLPFIEVMAHRQILERLILQILEYHDNLHYYQGFHELCSVFLLILGEAKTTKLVEQIALSRLRDFMDADIDLTLRHLELLYPLIGLEDKRLYDFLQSMDGLKPFFGISWILTWCAHDLKDFSILTRLYDFFLVSHPLTPLYIVAARILLERDTIFMYDPDDYSLLHTYLMAFPTDLDTEVLIARASNLMESHPPRRLQKMAQKDLGSQSCINTFDSNPSPTQTKMQLARHRHPSLKLFPSHMLIYSSLVLLTFASFWQILTNQF